MAFLLSCAVSSAKDELSFEQKTVTVNVPYQQDRITVSFPFKNKSDKGVVLGKIHPTCDCTTAEYKDAKKKLAPGEQCSVEAVMDTGSFTGTVPKDVIVHASGSRYTLTIKAVIPEAVTMEPRKLEWKRGEEHKAKEILITVDPQSGIKLKSVSLKGSDFDYEPVKIKEGRQYKVIVTPKPGTKKSMNTLWIETDALVARYRKFMAVLVTENPK